MKDYKEFDYDEELRDARSVAVKIGVICNGTNWIVQ